MERGVKVKAGEEAVKSVHDVPRRGEGWFQVNGGREGGNVRVDGAEIGGAVGGDGGDGVGGAAAGGGQNAAAVAGYVGVAVGNGVEDGGVLVQGLGRGWCWTRKVAGEGCGLSSKQPLGRSGSRAFHRHRIGSTSGRSKKGNYWVPSLSVLSVFTVQ